MNSSMCWFDLFLLMQYGSLLCQLTWLASLENGPQMGISLHLLPCHIPLVVEIRSLCKFAQCVVIPNNLQICFQAFSIIGIGHG